MRSAIRSLFALFVLIATAPAFAKEVAVSISAVKYKPATIQVAVGDTVVWTNDDDRGHTVVADDGTFASGEIGIGKTFQSKFTKAGEYSYHCEHHPRMRGKVVVMQR